MKPASAKKATVTEALAAVKRRLRNRPMSSSGEEVRRSHWMNVTSSATASTNPPMLLAELQPWFGASMIV